MVNAFVVTPAPEAARHRQCEDIEQAVATPELLPGGVEPATQSYRLSIKMSRHWPFLRGF